MFCKIARGEIPSQIVLEDDLFLAFRDINPKAPVHLLVIPREHLRSLDEIDRWREGEGHDLLSFVVRAADAAGVRESGYRVITNVGADAGQEVEHLHLHILGGGPLGDSGEHADHAPGAGQGGTEGRRKEEVGALRLLISELQKDAKDARAELDEEAELKVLRREQKKRLEATEAFRAGGREELLRHEEFEAALIEELLPQQLDEAQLADLVDRAIAETGATSVKDMGKVMSAVMSMGGAQVDGKRATALVRERLGTAG